MDSFLSGIFNPILKRIKDTVDSFGPPYFEELVDLKWLLIFKPKRRGNSFRYAIGTPNQQLVFIVQEEDRFSLQGLNYKVPKELKVLNRDGEEYMHMVRVPRPWYSYGVCKMQVLAPPGQLFGSVETIKSVARLYLVKNKEGEQLFYLHRKDESQFMIRRNHNAALVGRVARRYRVERPGDPCKRYGRRFAIVFHKSLTTKEKALLMANTLLIDYVESIEDYLLPI